MATHVDGYAQANDPNHDRRSVGLVVGRDLLTNDDTVFGSAERAAMACGIAAAAFRKSFLDHPRQLKGKVWRRLGKKVWVPPRGFVYDPGVITPGNCDYIEFRDVANGATTVYESLSAAGNANGRIPRKTITGYMGGDKPMRLSDGSLVTVRILHVSDYCNWQSEDVNVASATEVIPAVCSNRRIYGPVVARHIESGRERPFANVHDAATEFSIDPECLAVSVTDMTCQVSGWTFRRPTNANAWIPPTTFRYDASLKKPAKGAKMVVAFRKHSNGTEEVTDLYESILYAAKCTGLDKSTLGSSVGKEKLRADRYWRAATDADLRGSINI